MEKVYENINKYGEQIKGKFSHKAQRDGIVISVTSPFVEEIHIESDDNIHKAYSETYSLLPPQAEHPKGEYRSIYYNTEEQRYYRSEWRPKKPELEESEWGYIWVITDSEYITKHAKRCEKLQAHYRSYHDIHKGQLCVFTGYAIDPNGDFKKPSTIESKLILDDRTKWFFNPWSFKVSLLDENTIDGLVKEILPSRECLEESLERHDAADDELKRQERNKRWQSIKSIPKRVENFIGRYPRLLWLIITFGMLLVGIGSLIVAYLNVLPPEIQTTP